MTTKTSKTMIAASEFMRACRQMGWRAAARDNVVTIEKYFDANDREAYMQCDGEYYDLLRAVKARGGSMWGTDGSGVGGYSAMMHGRFVMNVSGVSASMVNAIRSLEGELC